MTVTVIFIIAISVFAAIGALIGLFKKATKASFWGVTVLLGVLVAMLIGKLAKDSEGYPYLVLGVTVGAVVILMLFFAWLKKFIAKRIDNAKEYSHYKNKDKVEENEAYIMNAVDKKDKRAYRKKRKQGRKIKDSAGGWGVFDRLLGFLVNGVNWLVAAGTIICALLLFIEFSGISQLQETEFVKELLASDGWVKFGSVFALDMMLIGALVSVIKSGFERGFFSVITLVTVLGMLVGFGFASWSIASSDACAGMVTGMQNGMLSSLTEVNADISAVVAKIIIAAVLFLLSLIIVILTGILLPKLLEKFRENDAFYVVDGIFGAVVCTAVFLVALLAVGGIAYTLNDLAFMEKFNAYEAKSAFADGFYRYNPFNSLFASLPIHDWLAPESASR